MKREIATRWVEALRSGDYKQTTNALRRGDSFCCLGVLCNLHAQDHPEIAAAQPTTGRYMGADSEPPDEVVAWAGLESNCGILDGYPLALTELNDDAGWNFVQIAAHIEANWEAL